MALDIKVYESQGAALVRLSGRVVLDECDRLKSIILPLVNPQNSQVNLELSGVEFIDSAGLGALVGIKVTSNKHRIKLALLNPSKEVGNILMVSKLDSIFDILTGADAQAVSDRLAKPGNERASGSSPAVQAMATSAGLPSMPSANATPGLAAAGASIPEQINALCRQAVDFMKAGNFEGAAKAYQRVLQLDPNYLPALNNLAIVYEKRPEWHEQSVEQWKRVLEISTANNDAKHMERANKHLEYLASLAR